jgi:peptide methionine sulfoxide reductase MsrB
VEFLKKKLVERCAEQKDLYYSAFEDEITEDVTKHCINSITLGFFETSKNTKC